MIDDATISIQKKVDPRDAKVYVGEAVQSPQPASVLWDPSDLTTPPILWYDASTINRKDGAAQDYITLDGGDVSQWNDRGLRGENLVQATASQQPELITSGNRFVEFIGVTEVLNTGVMATIVQPVHYFIGLKLTTGNLTAGLVDGGGGSGRNAIFQGGSNSWNLFAGDAVRSWSSSETTEHHVISGLFDDSGVGGEGYIDGLVDSFLTPGSETVETLRVGNISNEAASLQGRIMEVVVINEDLSDADRELVEGYLAWKLNDQYGTSDVVDNLDVGHTYKAAAPTV